MKSNRLTLLADALFRDVVKNKDLCFQTKVIVCPNVLMQQWIKSYWLQTQGEDVLLNVSFQSLNETLPLLVKQENYQLIDINTLRQVIISILSNDMDNIIPDEMKEYYKDSPIKLTDFASSLASLFLDYYRDDFEGINNWTGSEQEKLYEKIIEVCKDKGLATIEKPISLEQEDQVGRNKIYFFGFSKLDKVYRRLMNSCSFVEEYSLDVDKSIDTPYVIKRAPSMVREIEAVHTEICKLLNSGKRVSDILVVAPNLSDYENAIERVFHQDDKEYPSIPYVLSYREKNDTDVVTALKLLYKFYKNGFYTRLDFFNLVSNPVIKRVREIEDEEIQNWMQTIVTLNVYRQHEHQNDWNYIKKRLLLSKVSSVNFTDNVVSLNEGDYLPYTNIGFDDESIIKLVNIINDIDGFLAFLKDKTVIDNDFIDAFKLELDKWFSYTDGEIETNGRYKKLLKVLDTIKILDNTNIPIDTLFFSLFAGGMTSSIQRGNGFSQGITFVDFGVNSIYSAKYVFFIGANSKALPRTATRSELDKRDPKLDKDDELGFQLLYQNALESLYVSFVYVDLKDEEEFFLTPIIVELNKAKNKYLDGKYEPIPLDEKRPYSELFTRKEFKDKEYYNNLLAGQDSNDESNQEDDTDKPVVDDDNDVVENNFIETITVKDIEKFLAEPLEYRAEKLFNKFDSLHRDIKDEWEHFELDDITAAALIGDALKQRLNHPNDELDKDEAFKEARLNNTIPTINDEYEKHTMDKIVDLGETSFEVVRDIAGEDYQILEPYNISLKCPVGNEEKEWRLISNFNTVVYKVDDNRFYFELKKMIKEVSLSQFLRVYVLALMDLANEKEEKTYHITLVKASGAIGAEDDYGKCGMRQFDITPEEARDLLNKIYLVINDFNHNVATPLSGLNESIERYKDLVDELIGKMKAWSFFEQKGVFDLYSQLGYNPNDFEKANYLDEVNKQIEYIKFLTQKVFGEEEENEQQPEQQPSESDA